MSFKEQFKRLIDNCFVIESRMSSEDKLKRLIDLCDVIDGFKVDWLMSPSFKNTIWVDS